MAKSKLVIASRGRLFECAVQEPVNWELARKNTPGKLTFNVLNDETLAFHEGDTVMFEYDGTKLFYGFVFSKKRTSNRIISVTAYDQLRYFKNKDTYSYRGKTAAQVFQMIIKDYKLQAGIVADTKYVIPSRVEDNQELFSIVDTALNMTLNNTKKMYVMYDNYGKLALRDVEQLRIDLLIDAESGETFDYITSIDESTYNQIKLTKENKEEKVREVYIAKDTNSQNQWGVLQLTDTIQDGENGQVKANALLQLYNRKTRKLNINNVFGDKRVRGGTILGVQLYLGDLNVSNYMMVEKVRHSFYSDRHTMDVTVIGGDFVA